MSVIYWVNQGRLGNLLFQYVALRQHAQPRDTIVCFDGELFELIDVEERFVRLPRWLGWRVNYETNKMARRLARWGLVGATAAEVLPHAPGPVIESGEILRSVGRLSGVRVFDGYFQRDAWATPPPRIKPEVAARASALLADLAPGNGTRVAVHVRLGDYQDWSVLGKKGVALPLDYYRRAMQSIAARIRDVTFVIFTDSPEALPALADTSPAPCVTFESRSTLIDFAAMAACEHIVVSASSYSWWAAMIDYRADKIVIGPRYWTGFKSQRWFPATMQSERLEYIDA